MQIKEALLVRVKTCTFNLHSMSNMAAVKACMQCRTVKTKCRAVLGSPICERCTRKPFDCVSNQKKRGKKPGTKLYPTREDTSSRDEWPKDLDFPSEPSSQHHDFGRPVEIAPKANINSEIWTEPENLQPPGLFKRPMKGKFSLENILCASDVSDDTTRLTAKSASTPHRGDPIQRGLVSYYIATSLFQGLVLQDLIVRNITLSSWMLVFLVPKPSLIRFPDL